MCGTSFADTGTLDLGGASIIAARGSRSVIPHAPNTRRRFRGGYTHSASGTCGMHYAFKLARHGGGQSRALLGAGLRGGHVGLVRCPSLHAHALSLGENVAN